MQLELCFLILCWLNQTEPAVVRSGEHTWPAADMPDRPLPMTLQLLEYMGVVAKVSLTSSNLKILKIQQLF